MACPVCFENLKKFSVSRKPPCFQKPNNRTGMHTAEHNSASTQRCCVSSCLTQAPCTVLYKCGCVCQGLVCPIYTWVLRPTYIPGWWSLTRLGSHHGKSDKTGLAHRCSNKRKIKLSPSPTAAATARRLRPAVLAGRSAGRGGLFRRLEGDFHLLLRFARSGLRLGRLLQATDLLLQTLLLRLQGPDLRCCTPSPRCHLHGPGLQLHRLGW